MPWGPGRTFHPAWTSQSILRGTSPGTQGKDRIMQGAIPPSPPPHDFCPISQIPLLAGLQGLQELKAVDRWGWQQEQSNNFGHCFPQLLQTSPAFCRDNTNCSSPESGQ